MEKMMVDRVVMMEPKDIGSEYALSFEYLGMIHVDKENAYHESIEDIYNRIHAMISSGTCGKENHRLARMICTRIRTFVRYEILQDYSDLVNGMIEYASSDEEMTAIQVSCMQVILDLLGQYDIHSSKERTRIALKLLERLISLGPNVNEEWRIMATGLLVCYSKCPLDFDEDEKKRKTETTNDADI